MNLTELNALPDRFLDMDAANLHKILPGPTLIHLPGRRQEPLFVSILLHGNEDTGLKAIQSVLRGYQNRELPRALSLFVGNVSAARLGLRRLDGQPDYNRVWPGGEDNSSVEQSIMHQVVESLRSRSPFASIDIHNNTGLNPHYACINRLDQHFFHLATLFSRIVVYFIRPTGVQSAAFATLCPSVTIECGKTDTPGSEEHAAEFINACLHLSDFPVHPIAKHDMDLFHTVVTVKVPENIEFGFGTNHLTLNFNENIDHFNFKELSPGTPFGHCQGNHLPILAIDEGGNDVSESYFMVKGNQIVLRRQSMPAMLTRDERVIRQDCLCYLMERIDPGTTPHQLK
ncbi:M14 family metallopeptidase [Sulfurirhabdus autotrophica]|uniref:Succinylglutamate desuccinylase/aspartoacylase family protein n=1 Tax=Sulfurirhabdus autotrophica TaxID=1706046 RepID=A0A4R3XRU8_9PROT|nr:M14 family metallopeptidase [Sulfurirhabdus autotrophica]TCV82345.1 succinylglutamate desuccinylase/aspartoacylase family protein [Sulfurirhabdus autotrophica]